MKKITVVTVNYNTEDDTRNLLASIKKLNKSNFLLSIIVVDNGSKNIFKSDQSEDLEIIRIDENTGFTGGFNKGIKRALEKGADYVFIVNNDTILDHNIIENMLSVMESNSKIGITVPKIYFAKGHEFHKDRYEKDELGKVFWYAGGYMDWAHVQSIHRGVDEVDYGQYDAIEKVTFATGCCMLIKKEVLEKVGLFDDNFFLYYEDADLSERIKRAGYDIYYVPTAVLFHINASSSGGAGRGNTLQDYFITRNQMLFGMKYAPLRTKIALIRQSINLSLNGRPKQKQAIKDYYLGKFGKGTFFNE